MSIKLIGAMLIIAGCGSAGLSRAFSHRRTVCWLRDIIRVLEFMEAELCYKLMPLPSLCREVSALDTRLRPLLLDFASRLDSQISPEACTCMRASIAHFTQIPEAASECLVRFGNSIGKFDLQGQLQGISSVRSFCERKLAEFENNQDTRVRSYQTMGFCIGAALVIVLI